MPRRNYPRNHQKTPHLASRTLDIAYTPDIACHSKRRFATEKIAKRAAETQELTQLGLQLDVYQCPYCHGWHLTSRKD